MATTASKLTDTQIDLLRAMQQIRADPYCKSCGASGYIIMEDIQERETISVCTVCGEFVKWGMNDSHIEMLSKTLGILHEAAKENINILKPFEFIKTRGACAGYCGKLCKEHFEKTK